MLNVKDSFLILFLIALDQIIKFLITDRIIIIFKFPFINYSENYGAAFSLFENERIFLIIASLVIIGFVIYYYSKYKNLQLGLSLILAGAISNLIDRIFRGYIVDFINVGIWPVFNLADVYNFIGVLMIIFVLKKESLKKLLKKIKKE